MQILNVALTPLVVRDRYMSLFGDIARESTLEWVLDLVNEKIEHYKYNDYLEYNQKYDIIYDVLSSLKREIEEELKSAKAGY